MDVDLEPIEKKTYHLHRNFRRRALAKLSPHHQQSSRPFRSRAPDSASQAYLERLRLEYFEENESYRRFEAWYQNSIDLWCAETLNALANHGYLPRDGRNIRASQFIKATEEYGLDRFLRAMLTNSAFLEQQQKDAKAKASWLSIIVNPFAYAFGSLGMRPPGQKDHDGVPYLNLDQLGLHNAVEHDVSLSRLDFVQGDNISPQPQLIEELLASSSNGKTITVDDFVQLRRRRYETQKKDNLQLEFQALQIQFACGEVAMLLKLFGNGKEVPVEYMKALFQHGRLPREEGWSKRRWWPLGLLELNALVSSIKAMGIVGSPREGTVAVADN